MRDLRPEGPKVRSRVPAAFRPPALASWTVLFPPRELGLPHGRLTEPTPGPDPGGVSTFHMHETRPGWVPPTPRDGGVPTAGQMPPTAACHFSAASPTPRCHIPPAELTLTRRQQGFTHVHPSGLLLTCSPRVERGPSGLNPELRTPPLPATHVRAETGLNTSPGYVTGVTADPPSDAPTQCKRPRVAPSSGCASRRHDVDLRKSHHHSSGGHSCVKTRYYRHLSTVDPGSSVAGKCK
jgi:hypothetical protein